jgi:hypothetical protein
LTTNSLRALPVMSTRAGIPLLLFIAVSCFLNAQEPLTVRIRRAHQFAFFQEGRRSDSLVAGVTDRFRLVVPDTLKPLLVIETDNGIIRRTSNDSIITVAYIKGINYRTVYEAVNGKMVLSTMINGASDTPERTVVIRFWRRGEMILQNNFVVPAK